MQINRTLHITQYTKKPVHLASKIHIRDWHYSLLEGMLYLAIITRKINIVNKKKTFCIYSSTYSCFKNYNSDYDWYLDFKLMILKKRRCKMVVTILTLSTFKLRKNVRTILRHEAWCCHAFLSVNKYFYKNIWLFTSAISVRLLSINSYYCHVKLC